MFEHNTTISRRRAIRLAEMELESQRQRNISWLEEKLYKLYIEDRMRRLTAKRSAHLQPKTIIGWLLIET